MNWRAPVAVLVSILGFSVPVIVLVVLFGIDTRVAAHGPDAAKQLLALLGSVGIGYAAGYVSAYLARRSSPPPVEFTIRAVFDAARGNQNGPSPAHGRHSRDSHATAGA